MHPLVPRPVVRLAVLGVGVFMAGVTAATVMPATAEPVPVATRPVAARAPEPVARPQVVPLAIRPATPAGRAAHHSGDPATWSSNQLAAQLVFSCVQVTDLSTAAAHAGAGLGGIVVLGNPKDAAALAGGLAGVRAAAPHGLGPLVASDEEGGRVQRLKSLLPPLPSAVEMGTWPDARIEQTAHDYGVGMRSLGVHMALSPVADVAAPGGYVNATGRGFSADPKRVATAAVAWSQGLARAGVLSAVKHWPGHGHAGDSHTTAPAVPPLAALEGQDLLPFDAVLQSGASVVMVGHLRSEGLTEPGLPATLSPNALRVLRERAGPATVLLTDSVSMAASSSALGLTPPQAALRALQAGADWAMSCVDPLGAVAGIQAALDGGGLSREAAVASARRVLSVKHRLGLLTVAPTQPPAGGLDEATVLDGVVTLRGRALDPDAPEPARVQAISGGVVLGEAAAEAGAVTLDVPVAAGAEVCVVALDAGGGPSTALGCVTRP